MSRLAGEFFTKYWGHQALGFIVNRPVWISEIYHGEPLRATESRNMVLRPR